jgi:hypothetical protein
MTTYLRFRLSDGSFVGFDYAPLLPEEEAEFTVVEATPDQIARHRAGSTFRFADGALVEDAPPAPPAPVRVVTKVELYRQMTDDELALLDNWLTNTATLRQRMYWRDAVEIVRGDPEPMTIAVTLFGEGRAQELLG